MHHPWILAFVSCQPSEVQRVEGRRRTRPPTGRTSSAWPNFAAANSRFVVEQQGANAQSLAEIRTSGQQQIQQERIRARTRIELVRFTFRQIQTLERGIAGIFRATGSVADSAFRTLSAATSRIGNLFRRSNTDLNQGLIGALRATRVVDRPKLRSPDPRHPTLHDGAVAIIQRFETQASTGIAGALSGRSALGSLLGGGLAIGGGFALFQGLRNGLEVGGDFVQGLSVLQAQLELTEIQMQGVREQSIALGNDLTLPGVSALDAAQAIQIAAKQFASLGQGALPAAQAAAQGILQLSRATGVAAEEAARVVGAAVNVFGIEASEATAVADQVTNALKNAAGVGFNDFADSFTQAASVVNLFIGPAQEANEALAETNAALALLARGGIIGSDAGTSLKQFFLQANRGTADANKVLNEVVTRAGEIGSVFFDASGGARTLAESVDILRRGTEGLTDQQFSATLQKLFGSDAARSAAVLIRSTAGELERLTAANLEQGTAAEIAAAQNVGLRGALDALGSVIETQQIKTYEKYQAVLGRVVIKFSELLQAFFDGKGIFEIVRAGLVGIGIGLGALVAAKAAAESMQFLVIALRALVTPLGLVVAGVGAVAAAFNILRTVSPEFRAESDRLGVSLRDRLGGGLEEVGRSFERLIAFVRTVVLPGLVDFGLAAIRFVEPAVEQIGAAVQALLGLAAPLAALARSEEVVAVIGAVGDAAAGAATGIAAAATALASLVAAGDVSALRDRAILAFDGLGDFVIANVEPQLRAVVGFIDDFLSGGGGIGGRIGNAVRDFLLGPFQDAAKALGFFLGNLATDPRIIQALGQLVGLAILTGANFVSGFVQGAASNLDELGPQFGNLLRDALTAGIRAAFRNPGVVRPDHRRSAGGPPAHVGVPAVRRAGRGRQQRRDSLPGCVGERSTRWRSRVASSAAPTALERQATRQAERARASMVRVFQSINRDLQRLGQSTGGRFGVIDQAAIDNANRRLVETRERLGAVGTEAVLSRARTREAFTGMGNIASGFSSILRRDVAGGFASIRVGAGQLRIAVADTFNDIAAQAGGRAQAAGQVLGAALMSGVGAALAGKQLGGASSAGGKALGLAGIVGAALLPIALIPGPIGLALGGLSATVGLLTAAFTDNGEAAKIASQKVDDYTAILVRFNTVGLAITDVAGQITSVLLDQDDEIQSILARSGFRADTFAADSLRGAADISSVITDLASGLGVAGSDIETFTSKIDRLGLTSDEAIKQLDFGRSGRLGLGLENAGVDVEAFIDLLRVLFDENAAVQGALAEADLNRGLNPGAFKQTADNAERVGRADRRHRHSDGRLLRCARPRQHRIRPGVRDRHRAGDQPDRAEPDEHRSRRRRVESPPHGRAPGADQQRHHRPARGPRRCVAGVGERARARPEPERRPVYPVVRRPVAGDPTGGLSDPGAARPRHHPRRPDRARCQSARSRRPVRHPIPGSCGPGDHRQSGDHPRSTA